MISYLSSFSDFSNFLLHISDKQEIKTVRIVKRESERRHKDKLSQNYDGPIDSNNQQDLHQHHQQQQQQHHHYQHPNEFLSTYQPQPRTTNYYEDEPSASKAKSTIRNAMHSTSMANSNTNSNTVRSDNTLFQSNTARQIMSERGNAAVAAVVKPEQTKTGYSGAGGASSNNSNNNQSTNQYKRFTPRKKKRHNTAPTSENFMDYMAERDSYKYVSSH